MMLKLAIVFLIFMNLDAASIQKYFHLAENKPGICGMPGIDFIYMINLDKRPEKYYRTMKELAPYGIFPYRFSAVNGWQLSNQAIGELGVHFDEGAPEGPIASVFRHEDGKEYMSFEIMKEPGVSYYCHSMSRGAIGCILSHLSVLQDAYDSGYNTIWIIEDDIKVVSNPLELTSLMSDLDVQAPDWDVLFTDNEIKAGDGSRTYCLGIRPRPKVQLQPLYYYTQRQNVTPDIMKIGLRFGSTSMIVRRTGMKKILDYFKTYKIYFPYDLDYCFVPDIKLYQCVRDIVTNIPGGVSDVSSATH